MGTSSTRPDPACAPPGWLWQDGETWPCWGLAGISPVGTLPFQPRRVSGAPEGGVRTPRVGDMTSQVTCPLPRGLGHLCTFELQNLSFGWLHFSDGEYARAHPRSRRARARSAVPQPPFAVPHLGTAGRGGRWMQGHLRYRDGVSWTPRPRTGEVGVCKAHRGTSSAGAIIINMVLEARFLSWLWRGVGDELGGLPSCACSKELLQEEPPNRSAAARLGSESGGI